MSSIKRIFSWVLKKKILDKIYTFLKKGEDYRKLFFPSVKNRSVKMLKEVINPSDMRVTAKSAFQGNENHVK